MNVGELGNFISYAFALASIVAPLGTVRPPRAIHRPLTANMRIRPCLAPVRAHRELPLRPAAPGRALLYRRSFRPVASSRADHTSLRAISTICWAYCSPSSARSPSCSRPTCPTRASRPRRCSRPSSSASSSCTLSSTPSAPPSSPACRSAASGSSWTSGSARSSVRSCSLRVQTRSYFCAPRACVSQAGSRCSRQRACRRCLRWNTWRSSQSGSRILF